MATVLQQRVWEALLRIPRGKVTTYGLIARYLGTRGVRAVATAVGKNPDAPEVPCHRVVLSDGTLGNYSGKGGVGTKKQLLAHEGVIVTRGRIDDFGKVVYTYQ